MTIQDEIRRIAPIKDKEFKSSEVRNAWFLFERNPFLSVDKVAQGLALLVEEYLHEDDAQVRVTFLRTLNDIMASRPHAVGRKIDWDALTLQLSHVPLQEVRLILLMLRYANDEKYLLVLESYFDDLSLRPLAVKSWIPLAYHQIYKGNPQVWPHLDKAYWMITGRNVPPPPQQEKRYVGDKPKELIKGIYKTPGQRPIYKDEMMQIIAETKQTIRRDVLAQQTSNHHTEIHEEDPTTFVNQVRIWLTTSDKESKQWKIEGLDWIFEEDISAFVDDVAQVVKLLVDDALKEDDASVRWSIWSVVFKAFRYRVYVGTYLDWKVLTERLPLLSVDELWRILSYYGYATDESYFSVLEDYLEHSDSSIRLAAAQAMCHLIYHVSRYNPEVSRYFQETSRAIEGMKETPDSPESRDTIRSILHEFQQKARSYYEYYSI